MNLRSIFCAHDWEIRVTATHPPGDNYSCPWGASEQNHNDYVTGYDDLLLTCTKCGGIKKERVRGSTGKNLVKNAKIPSGM